MEISTMTEIAAIESGNDNEPAAGAAVLIREIYKNGWLKVPVTDRKLGPLSKANKSFYRIWVAFCIHDDTEPFLEFYECQQNVLGHKSTQSWHLNRCLHISPNISLDDDDHAFSVTLETQILNFATSSRDEMMEWISTLRNKLLEMKILGPVNNIYSKEPELKPRLAPSRDPTSPLPPPPGYLQLPPGTSLPHQELLTLNTQVEQITSTPDIIHEAVLLRQSGRDTNDEQNRHSLQEISSESFSLAEFPSGMVPSSAPPHGSTLMNDNIFDFSTLAISIPDSEQNELENSIYEPLHLTTSPSLQSSDLYSNRDNESSSSRENVEITDNLSLKEKQVAQLNRQINHPAGIRLRIRRKDCLNSIALGNFIGHVWILGWKQRSHPLLYHNFHIGDKIVTVEGIKVTSPHQMEKIIKQTYTPSVEFLIHRVPFGKAFAIKRDYDGQELGLIRENNTAEIVDVVDGGLAACHGLTLKTTSPTGLGFCNWTLTEINGRPLNLFYKGNEIQDRLHAVGKDISILVQPSDFVKALKKQLKSLRSYKDYIVQ